MMIHYDSLDNDSQMAITIGLFEALKDARKIHAESKDSGHSLDCSSTCSTTIDNTVIRELFKKQVERIAK